MQSHPMPDSEGVTFKVTPFLVEGAQLPHLRGALERSTVDAAANVQIEMESPRPDLEGTQRQADALLAGLTLLRQLPLEPPERSKPKPPERNAESYGGDAEIARYVAGVMRDCAEEVEGDDLRDTLEHIAGCLDRACSNSADDIEEDD